ncbi:MAG: TetR/AcrR family transcriptional regulator, partial [Deltaproteobacteria bacterium]|nr:TetR/AcrR family transcriptional regulator [Deltaproteobacteria bacterium]
MEDYDRFKAKVGAVKQSCYLEFFAKNPQVFQIKKEKTISKNLERIFAAAIKISNKKGYHAMSMRDLSKEVHLSVGALYNYFSGKEELLEMMQRHRRTITSRVLKSNIAAEKEPLSKLRAAIRTHLYLSEAMQPWFFFSYMEAKNIGPKERRAAVQGELNTEQMFADIISMGRDRGVFVTDNCQLTASIIKAMVQDWYLKRAKYARRRIDVEAYARFMIAFIEKSLVNQH